MTLSQQLKKQTATGGDTNMENKHISAMEALTSDHTENKDTFVACKVCETENGTVYWDGGLICEACNRLLQETNEK